MTDDRTFHQQEVSEQRVAIRRRLAEIQDTALEAKEKYEDLAWLHDALEVMQGILNRIEQYNPAEHRPEAGIFLLAEIKAALISIFGQLQALEEYRELTELLTSLTSQEDGSPDDDEG